MLEDRTGHLTRLAYEWCSVVCENLHRLTDGKKLLLLSLEIGFRHLSPKSHRIEAKLTHTNHHLQMTEIFRDGDSGAIVDLLRAWTSQSNSHQPYMSLNLCAGHLVKLHRLQPFSPGLRQLLIHTVELIGYQGFKRVEVERFAGLLDDLHVCIEDMGNKIQWAKLLLDIIRSSRGIQNLPHFYWELMAKLAASERWWEEDTAYHPRIIISLENAREWDKLECWVGVVWMVWTSGPKNEDLQRVTLLLFRQQPNAIQKLKGWIHQRSNRQWYTEPKAFQQICEQAEVVP